MSDFDFDSWRDLAERNPAAYFHARSEAIDALIASYPPQQGRRLLVLQRRIDCIRARSGSPMKAVGCLAVMMHDRVERLEKHHAALEVLTRRLASIALRTRVYPD